MARAVMLNATIAVSMPQIPVISNNFFFGRDGAIFVDVV
jgi:hypothetical protein